jgi:hypothetical protein
MTFKSKIAIIRESIPKISDSTKNSHRDEIHSVHNI